MSNFTCLSGLTFDIGYCVSATPCRANILPMSVLPRYHASVYCPRFKGSPKFPGSLVEKSSLHSVNSRTPARSANKTKPKVPEKTFSKKKSWRKWRFRDGRRTSNVAICSDYIIFDNFCEWSSSASSLTSKKSFPTSPLNLFPPVENIFGCMRLWSMQGCRFPQWVPGLLKAARKPEGICSPHWVFSKPGKRRKCCPRAPIEASIRASKCGCKSFPKSWNAWWSFIKYNSSSSRMGWVLPKRRQNRRRVIQL